MRFLTRALVAPILCLLFSQSIACQVDSQETSPSKLPATLIEIIEQVDGELDFQALLADRRGNSEDSINILKQEFSYRDGEVLLVRSPREATQLALRLSVEHREAALRLRARSNRIDQDLNLNDSDKKAQMELAYTTYLREKRGIVDKVVDDTEMQGFYLDAIRLRRRIDILGDTGVRTEYILSFLEGLADVGMVDPFQLMDPRISRFARLIDYLDLVRVRQASVDQFKQLCQLPDDVEVVFTFKALDDACPMFRINRELEDVLSVSEADEADNQAELTPEQLAGFEMQEEALLRRIEQQSDSLISEAEDRYSQLVNQREATLTQIVESVGDAATSHVARELQSSLPKDSIKPLIDRLKSARKSLSESREEFSERTTMLREINELTEPNYRAVRSSVFTRLRNIELLHFAIRVQLVDLHGEEFNDVFASSSAADQQERIQQWLEVEIAKETLSLEIQKYDTYTHRMYSPQPVGGRSADWYADLASDYMEIFESIQDSQQQLFDSISVLILTQDEMFKR